MATMMFDVEFSNGCFERRLLRKLLLVGRKLFEQCYGLIRL